MQAQKEKMKINTELLNNILNKVNAAVGNDQLRMRFFSITQGENSTNICEFLACSNGLQIVQMLPYSGKAVTSKEQSFVIKASALTGIVRSYMALGIASITIECKDTNLIIKNASGQVTLPTTTSMTTIDLMEAQKGTEWKFLVWNKEMGTAVKNVSTTIGTGSNQTNGIYFCATESGYRLMTTNTYAGSQSSLKIEGEFTPMTGTPTKTKDFFVSNGLMKALAVLKDKLPQGNDEPGRPLNVAIADNYLVIMDAEGTYALVALNKGDFPYKEMVSLFSPKSAATSMPETFDVKVKKSVMEAAINLVEVTDADKVKRMLIKGVLMGDKSEITVTTGSNANPQTIPAEVNIVTTDKDAASLGLATNLFRTVLGNVGEDVSLRFTTGYVLLYDGNSDIPAAWIFKKTAVNTASAEKTEE